MRAIKLNTDFNLNEDNGKKSKQHRQWNNQHKMKGHCSFLVSLILMLTSFLTSVAAHPNPYSIELSDGLTLHGELLTPENAIKQSLVIIIAGSGPTDRNGNSPLLPGANNSLKYLAESLGDNNIASFRFDKRGIGESSAPAIKENMIRFEHYIADVEDVYQHFKHIKRFKNIIIAGHSEGSLIGMIAAKNVNADGYVSLAGAGYRASDILRQQLSAQLPETLNEKSEKVILQLEKGELSNEVPSELEMIYRKSVQPYLISWFRYDPSVEVAKLKAPVLIVQGTTDIQVGLDNAKRLKSASKKAQYVEIVGMNHVLKMVTNNMSEQQSSYSDPTLPISKILVRSVAKFVTELPMKE